MVARHISYVPRGVKLALIFICISISWGTFKTIEPTFFPAAEDFQIHEIRAANDRVIISGTFNKLRRDCVFAGQVGYENIEGNPAKQYINIVYTLKPDSKDNRKTGLQTYKKWALLPIPKDIELTTTHDCWTGKLDSVLYNGPVSLTERRATP